MRETKRGVEIEIRVIPKAQTSCLIGWEADRLKVRIVAQPEKGRANQEVVRYFSKLFRIAKSSISIILGEKSRDKTLAILGISLEECSQKINKELSIR